VARSEFVVQHPKTDRARTRKVLAASTNKVVGFICEPDGQGAGFAWRLPGTTEWSETNKSLKATVLSMAEHL